jgi:hypothetical protein
VELVSVGAETGEPTTLESLIIAEGEAGEGAATGDMTTGGVAGAGTEDSTIGDHTGHWDVDVRSGRWWSRGLVSASNGGGFAVEEPGVTEELGVAAIRTTMNGN